MKTIPIILSLGSNLNKEEQIRRAASELRALFPSIQFSTLVQTEAHNCPEGTPAFLNQVAYAQTDKAAEDVKTLLKQIEQSLGRRKDDKQKGLIPIDLDLLLWGDLCLKPRDLQRDYVLCGLQELSLSV